MTLILTKAEVSPPAVCATAGCDGVPEVYVLWPGKPARLACAKCSAAEIKVAATQGFELLLQAVKVKT